MTAKPDVTLHMEQPGVAETASLPTYVLVTPARNESAYIEATIQSVVTQTVLPLRWIVVSDGSTDGTDEIIQRYAAQYSWIRYHRMPERRDRQFAAKAHCFNSGYSLLKDVAYEIVGNLDADITMDAGYFEFLLRKFSKNRRLGVAGTPFIENAEEPGSHTYAHAFASLQHVSGACQLFRRECFAEVGGYVPVRGGAIDWIAVTTARMNGWQTRTFPERTCLHHRQIGTGTDRTLMVRFRYGQKAYYVGGHPVWELLRGCFQMRQEPRIVGGLMFQAGYLWGLLTRMPRPVSPELMTFHRQEQMSRLRALWRRKPAQPIS